MKKVIVFVIILILLGSAVFFFGWIQIHLAGDQYAVIFTKTRGWEPEVIVPGTFSWRWERLIPTNTEIHIFTVSPRSSRISTSGSLPGAVTYAEIFDIQPDFSYELNFSVTYRLFPASLPGLAADKGLRPENMEAWYADLDGFVLDEAVSILRVSIDALKDEDSILSIVSSFTSTLESALVKELPYIEVLTVSPHVIELPDIDLYMEAKERYFQLLSVKSDTAAQSLARASERKIEQDMKLDLLERYGELLTKYPILLDYFSLDTVDLDAILPEIQSSGAFE